jgi:uncharacterized protein YegL
MADLQKLLLQGAQEDGLVGKQAMASMNVVDLGDIFGDNLGVDPTSIDSTEVFALFVVLDDSTSIRMKKNTSVVRDGLNSVFQALTKSKSRDDIIVCVLCLNAGALQPPVPLPQAVRLDNSNYNPNGMTPLYDRSIEVGALAAAKYRQFAATGASFRGVIFLLSDGNDEGSTATPAKVKPVFEDLQAQEIFQVIAMGISDGRTDFKAVYESMGVLPNMILTPDNDAHDIRDAFGVVSRATVSASQGGSLSQAGGMGGFGAADPDA